MADLDVFGMTPFGESVHSYTLTAGPSTVRVMDFGATVLGIAVPDAHGTVADVVLGFDDLEGYLDNPACHGCTIGPSANRTDRGEVPIGGQIYQLPKNDGPELANNLHTDLVHGLHKRMWSGSIDKTRNAVTFVTHLSDGELGLPGNRAFTVDYELGISEQTTTLTITQRCTTDIETFVNMTNHMYFNLEGHASGPVLNHQLSINADRFLPLRDDNISYGVLQPVAGTAFDFRIDKEIGVDIDSDDEQIAIARGYDHCFCIRGFDPLSVRPRHALRATAPHSRRALDISISAPGAHLYTGNWLNDTGAKDGAHYTARAGFAFEPEFYPDNVHHEDWAHPACTSTCAYEQVITYRFSTY